MSDVTIESIRLAFERFPLDGVLFALNRACRDWQGGTFPRQGGLLKDLAPRNPAFMWFAAEAARHAIAWSPQRSSESRISIRSPEPTQAELIDLLSMSVYAQTDLRLARVPEQLSRLRTDPLLDIVSRLWYAQCLVEKRSPFRVGQALLTYKHAPRRRADRDPRFPLRTYEETLRQVLGCDLDSFLLALMQIAGISHGENPCVNMARTLPPEGSCDENLLTHAITQHLRRPSSAAVIAALSATPQTLLACMQGDLLHADPYAILDAPNPLLRFPLVSPFRDRVDRVIAPVPHLLLEWLYEPLFGLLYDARRAAFSKIHLSQLFEEYVGLLSDRCAPDQLPWIHESRLKSAYRGRVVDWARQFTDAVVLIDAKRCFLSNQRRYRSAPGDWDQTHETWSKGATQCAAFWDCATRGMVPALSASADKPCIAVVVAQWESELRGLNWHTRETISEHLTTQGAPSGFQCLVLSLDRFEQLMSTWSGTGEADWLPRKLLEVAAGKPVEILNALEARATGPLWNLLEDLVGRLAEAVRRSGDDHAVGGNHECGCP